MGKSERTKGAAAEREVATLLFHQLGIEFERQLRQYQEAGGFDLAPKPGQPTVGYLIEVKRRERPDIPGWWFSAFEHANGKPFIVFYRANRQPWLALVDLVDLNPDVFHHRGIYAIIPAIDAITLIRESVNETV